LAKNVRNSSFRDVENEYEEKSGVDVVAVDVVGVVVVLVALIVVDVSGVHEEGMPGRGREGGIVMVGREEEGGGIPREFHSVSPWDG